MMKFSTNITIKEVELIIFTVVSESVHDAYRKILQGSRVVETCSQETVAFGTEIVLHIVFSSSIAVLH